MTIGGDTSLLNNEQIRNTKTTRKTSKENRYKSPLLSKAMCYLSRVMMTVYTYIFVYTNIMLLNVS